MKGSLRLFGLLALASLAPAARYVTSVSGLVAYAAGLALFGGNLLLLTFVVGRLLGAASSGETPRGTGALAAVMLVKLGFLGAGVALALLVFRLPPYHFLAGLTLGLTFFALACFIPGSQRGAQPV